jgi:hypothetical protein
MVDANMAITENKVIDEYVFMDKELIKKKSVADWEEE